MKPGKLQEAAPDVKMFDFMGHLFVGCAGAAAQHMIDEEEPLLTRIISVQAFMTAEGKLPMCMAAYQPNGPQSGRHR